MGDFHLVTKSRIGTVSAIKNITLEHAKELREKMDPNRGMPNGGMRMCQDGDIEQFIILGPEGWETSR